MEVNPPKQEHLLALKGKALRARGSLFCFLPDLTSAAGLGLADCVHRYRIAGRRNVYLLPRLRLLLEWLQTDGSPSAVCRLQQHCCVLKILASSVLFGPVREMSAPAQVTAAFKAPFPPVSRLTEWHRRPPGLSFIRKDGIS
jgi:hypothetical protein